MNERRYKRVILSIALLNNMMKQCQAPEDTLIVDVDHNTKNGTIDFIIQSSSFPVLPELAYPPVFEGGD